MTLEEKKILRAKLKWLTFEIGKTCKIQIWYETVLVYTNTFLEVNADIMCAETMTQALPWMLKSKFDGLSRHKNHSSQQNYFQNSLS